jgi:hypothetical protein
MFKPSGKLGGSENAIKDRSMFKPSGITWLGQAPIAGSRLSHDGAWAGGLSPSHQ